MTEPWYKQPDDNRFAKLKHYSRVLHSFDEKRILELIEQIDNVLPKKYKSEIHGKMSNYACALLVDYYRSLGWKAERFYDIKGDWIEIWK